MDSYGHILRRSTRAYTKPITKRMIYQKMRKNSHSSSTMNQIAIDKSRYITMYFMQKN